MRLPQLLEQGRTIRVIGFDDGPFDPSTPLRAGSSTSLRAGSSTSRGGESDDPSEPASSTERVPVCGVVCGGVRFEGMIWGSAERDGMDATDTVIGLLREGKFLPQLDLLLADGVSFGGLNILDLDRLYSELGLPVAAVMRRSPDLPKMEAAIKKLLYAEERLDVFRRAGTIHTYTPFHFQCRGEEPDTIAAALARITDTGHVPEALRIAHLVASAVVKGESGRRA